MAKDKDNENPTPIDDEGRLSVLIEMRSTPGQSAALVMGQTSGFDIDGFKLDQEFEPVVLPAPKTNEGQASGLDTYIVRATLSSKKLIKQLKERPEVADVWKDTPISPFGMDEDEPNVQPDDNLGSGTCPIGTCDCEPWNPKGTMADVATYLGVDRIWGAGYRGSGIVVGVLDSGITAQGRPVKSGETSRRIPRVIGGWPSDWGTESSKWSNHGNMCATDVLGMAPEAQLYDLRIAGSGGSPGTISRALQAFQWAINQYRTNGTPHILTNSWGIFQETWDTSYARNPNHPFTRKVIEAIDAGIIVLFAAGNCGSTCPDGRCGADNGPGRSIWGANSHERVMTAGAVNKNEQFVGYSSQGPGALHADKPDFCSITHFTGYNTSDSGTSAATPIAAGVCALLKNANASLTHDQVKQCLMDTAKDIGPSGFDRHSGAGIIQAWDAYQRCGRRIVITRPTIDTTPIRDRITIATRDTAPARDAITIPTRDTSAIRDRLTIASRDTAPTRDIRTNVLRDTSPARDQLTTPARDQLTSPTQDVQGTNPRLDPVKSPRLDTRDERLRPIDPIRDPIREPIRQPGGQRPFVLSTPHHAENWRDFDDDPYAQHDEYEGYESGYDDFGSDQLAALEDQIAQLSEQLDALIEDYQTLTGEGGGSQGGSCCCSGGSKGQRGGSGYDDDFEYDY
jgi:subtilisin family serine protease